MPDFHSFGYIKVFIVPISMVCFEFLKKLGRNVLRINFPIVGFFPRTENLVKIRVSQ